ncbi:hypothetical protein [Roseomonas sp. KE0001]|uniref:hypothetical protein n=1 Tax=Roseomonas sp. KE0001 TaxID=2479201 RepID=UPI0018DFA980|nr:hypothetical protein [Roseomonas sp. KE0001]MBI0436038.1 hypothetical protein [Roseomonas sp. KE0001]
MPSELNQRNGGPPTGLHQTLERRREAEALKPALQAIEQVATRQRGAVQRLGEFGERVTQAVRQAAERLRLQREVTVERGQGSSISL